MAADAVLNYLEPTVAPSSAIDPSAPVIGHTDAEDTGRTVGGQPVFRQRAAVFGPLTDAELRATPVPISGTITATVDETTLAKDATLTNGSVRVGGTVQVDASGHTVPVSGPLTDTQLRANPVPVSGTVTVTDGSGPLTVDGTSLTSIDSKLTHDADGNLPVTVMSALIPREYDYINLSYTGSDLTGVVYKQGGVSGATVATLALAYSSGVLLEVTRT